MTNTTHDGQPIKEVELEPGPEDFSSSAPQQTGNPGPVGLTKPRRSWKRGVKASGTYDARFKYEDAIIYIQSLADDEWGELEAIEEKLQDDSTALGVFQADLAAKEREQNPKKKLPPQQLAILQKQFRKQSNEIAERLFSFQQTVVNRTVVNWENAPDDMPFSKEALAELPREMVSEWAQVILQKSRLGQGDANFLANS